ncbi:ArsA family ATPase [Fervidibacillus halotolerans]|uniref:ArsA family ATPase n=1 Tax=Fervidibacillus halotolerans TaxID=2980027 RepID=A0A9E8M1J6_9BACI|nr:ArsA family ATPase [Fervidibacillus halotolerans]WAA13190.1 ArsA family ATPase [Fervidibacillus halotolerans]
MEELKKTIIFVGGKGGVGKTTIAAAISMKLSDEGNKTLLISTDPAHNLGDLFGQRIGGKINQVKENLYALEIDPELETTNYINQVKENVQGLVNPTMMEEVYRMLDTAKASPGADEAALFDRIISIILDEKPNFDKIIFDTAPTGHTIRLLTLPELMNVWIEGLLMRRKKTRDNYVQLLNDGEPIEDPIYDVLRKRRDRFREARSILLNHDETAFLFVLNPERLPIMETEKATRLLDQYHLHVKTLVVNKVLPEQVEGDFLQERKKHEKVHLEWINRTFQNKQLIFIPFFSKDITTKEQLRLVSEYL